MIKIERYSYPEKLIDTSKDDFEVIEMDTVETNYFGKILSFQLETKLKTIFPKPVFDIMLIFKKEKIPERIFILFKNNKQKQIIEEWINKEGYLYLGVDIKDRFVFDIKENQVLEVVETISKNKNSVKDYLGLFHNLVFDYFGKDINIKIKVAIYKNKLIAFELIPTGKGVNDDIVF